MRSWHKSREELIAFLTLKNAQAAMAGRPCPVAARVQWRLELLADIAALSA